MGTDVCETLELNARRLTTGPSLEWVSQGEGVQDVPPTSGFLPRVGPPSFLCKGCDSGAVYQISSST